MSGIRSGEMLFLSADLYPSVITTGLFENDTSTMANPEKDDQEVLGENKDVSETTSNEPKSMSVFLAIILIVILVFVFGIGD